MSFDRAMALADAVLMEGYALYPYRASAAKNRYRWTFGVVAPRAWSEAGGCEPWWLETQFPAAGAPGLTGRLRFFQIDRARAWDEGVLRTVDFAIPSGRSRVAFAFAGSHELAGEIVLAREAVTGDVERIAIRIENHSAFADAAAPRDGAMIAAFASTHVLVAAHGGALLSAIDAPVPCEPTGLHAALVGRDVLLAAPFILPDHAQVAPESPGDLCDATEIDEILLLRTRLLTDDEKREARATDPRAAAIIDRADAMAESHLARLHGIARDVVAGEMVPRPPAPGTKVRLLAPRSRRTDAQDLLYAGCIATVAELREDVDGTTFLAVTLDDDPAGDLQRRTGRYRYYRLDEVEAL